MPIEAFNEYEQCIQKMDSENKEIICIGDFNCGWLQPDKVETQRLSHLARMYQLDQMIDEPTRVPERSRTQIDLIFSNRPEIIIKSGVHHIVLAIIA